MQLKMRWESSSTRSHCFRKIFFRQPRGETDERSCGEERQKRILFFREQRTEECPCVPNGAIAGRFASRAWTERSEGGLRRRGVRFVRGVDEWGVGEQLPCAGRASERRDNHNN